MADLQPHENSSSSDVSGGNSESTIQLNIKTLDSRIYSLQVDKNIVVSAFKEKISSQSGVPVGQQRLIFRGKVLKDDHLLAEYNMENGDTLHLVERQSQPSPGSRSISGEATPSNGNRGQDSTAGPPRNRFGQIAHSVVLGTVNVGDPGETAGPDISRVIGAVLNSFGIGNVSGGVQPGVQTSHGNETEGSPGNVGSQSHGGNHSVPLPGLHGQSAFHAMQIPLGAAIAVPTLNMPIPDSLNTLIDFMNRMELAFSERGNQPDPSPAASGDQPTTELPTNSRRLPTIEALSTVLRHAERLLSGHAVPALSHTAGRLDQEGGSNDPAVRGQVQTESVQLGIAMQHLGSLLLELGRTLLTLRMGQSPAESFVNAGPAVYISPSGPNPLMVQPFPLQTSSLFGGSSGPASNPVAMGPVTVGSIPRNVNIHIHTGAPLAPIIPTVGNRAPNGEGMRGESANGNESAGSAQTRGLSGMNVTATAVPLQPPLVSISGAVPPGTGVLQVPHSNEMSSVVAEINDQLRRSLVANTQNELNALSGQSEGSTNRGQRVGDGANQRDLPIGGGGHGSLTLPHVTMMDDQKAQTVCQHPDNVKEKGAVINSSNDSSTSSGGFYSRSSASEHSENQGNNPDASSGPLGLGLGGLQPKRRGKQPKAQSKNSDGATASSQNQQSRAVGQQVLQSLASLSMKGNENVVPSGQSPDFARGVAGSVPPTARQQAGSQIDMNAISQLLQSPALEGVLSGVSQQAGVGSPDMFRNMLQQFTQDPALSNTINQIAQQVDTQDLGSMFSDLNRGQGGGMDLSRIMQQMMPIVSQALGGISSLPETPSIQPGLSQSRSRRDATPTINDPQIDFRQVVQSLENRSSSEEVFRSLVERAVHFSSNGSAGESLVNELCSQEGLAQEFMDLLRRDISRRLQDDTGS
ncbi:hypothetical protein ACJIZ3_024744 [Penstemon smallii]|uniref:Ubiquitin-like domain-containing protein n=1 Tax=Penstemon smallii TaxID=265156 RepID=A0ABD3TW08_9LAMI